MTETEKKKFIAEHIKKHPFGMLAVVHPNNFPIASVVGVSQRDNFELIFDTSKKTRKYKNLKCNPNVAVAVGWNEITVQYEGVAHELEGLEKEECQKVHLAKMPSEIEFIRNGGLLFKITPKWVKYSDFTKQPSETFELVF